MSTTEKQGVINIRGKEYKTVALRVNEFRECEQTKLWSIETELISNNDYVVMKATIKDEKERIIGTGYAEEKRGASQINKTSALENCETSAIGRALAACGLAGTEYASANEVENAIHQQTKDKKPRVNKQQVQKYVSLFVDAIEAEDGLAMLEMGEELKDTPEHDAVWNMLDTKQKKAIKSIIFSQTNEAKDE